MCSRIWFLHHFRHVCFVRYGVYCFLGLFKFSGLLQTPFWLVWRPASSPPGTEIISQHQVVWDRPQASEAIHVSVRCTLSLYIFVPCHSSAYATPHTFPKTTAYRRTIVKVEPDWNTQRIFQKLNFGTSNLRH